MLKGGITLSSIGYLQVHTYASNAEIPIKDASITITDLDGGTIAMRLTNRSGKLDDPIKISVPDLSASQTPNTGVIPFTTVNLFVKAEDYEEIYVKNVQIFPDLVTLQNLELIPIAEFPLQWIKSETFQIPVQNL